MTSSDSTVPSVCVTAHALSYHPIYRVSQIYQFVVLTFAVFPLVYFIFFKAIKSGFHGNLKWILVGYFGSVLLFNDAFLLMGFIQVLIPLMTSNKCDLIIDAYYYKIGCICGSLLMTLPTFFPISITIERFMATRMAKNYERTPVILGPVLTFLVIFLDSFLIFLIYKNEEFLAGSISFVFLPASVAPKMFSFFWMMLIINVINFFANFFLLRENARLKKTNSTLAARYQLEEVYLSTKFAISVIFVHVIFFGIYVSLTILSRYFGGILILDPIDLSAARGALMTMIATYNFIIGIVAVYLYKRIRTKKTVEINVKIQMKSTGNAGAQNYDNAIFSIWNSTSSGQRPTAVF